MTFWRMLVLGRRLAHLPWVTWAMVLGAAWSSSTRYLDGSLGLSVFGSLAAIWFLIALGSPAETRLGMLKFSERIAPILVISSLVLQHLFHFSAPATGVDLMPAGAYLLGLVAGTDLRARISIIPSEIRVPRIPLWVFALVLIAVGALNWVNHPDGGAGVSLALALLALHRGFRGAPALCLQEHVDSIATERRSVARRRAA